MVSEKLLVRVLLPSARVIFSAPSTVEQVSAPTLEEILAADHAARKAVRAHIQ